MIIIQSRIFISAFVVMSLCMAPMPITFGEDASDPHAGHDHTQHDDHEDHSDHQEQSDHEDHDDHSGHEDALTLTPEEMQEFEISLATAQPGSLAITLDLSGEIAFNPDGVAHVTSLVPGVAQQVHQSIGDQVREGDLLAILQSRELAQAKSEHLASLAHLAMAQTNHDREQKLWKQKIIADRVYLQAKQALLEAQITNQLSQRQLYALGLSANDIKNLPNQPHDQLTEYHLTAPINGTIVERHLVRGEVVTQDIQEAAFIIADLTSVWVNLAVHQIDLARVRKGMKITVHNEATGDTTAGAIDYISPAIDEATRTATARVAVDNTHGNWRPGMFVTASVSIDTTPAQVMVPRAALQTMDDANVVFVKTDHGFEPRPVTLGSSDQNYFEITAGLSPGESYVATNAFTLKAQLGKGDFGHAGHAH